MTIKQSVTWNKVIERMPESGKDYLVWTGSHMIVSTAEVYTEEERKRFMETVNDPQFGRMFINEIHLDEAKKHYLNCSGRFREFGQSYYFDDPKVEWAELPLAPGEKNPPPPDPFEGMVSKDAYFKKDDQIVGIHAIGYPGPHEHVVIDQDGTRSIFKSDFMQMEIWGNEYDDEHNMLGRGSFRVFDQFENEVKNWEADGWVQIKAPKKKEA